MAVGDAQVFPGFLTPVLTQISFHRHYLLFSYASAEKRGENTHERNFNGVSNSQPPGHESDMLTTEPSGQRSTHQGQTSQNVPSDHTDLQCLLFFIYIDKSKNKITLF